MRRILPSIGSLDTASVVLALLVVVAKILLLTLMAGEDFNLVATLIFALVSLFKKAGVLLFWILIIRAILSWVSQGRNPIEYVMMQLTEPLLAPIRRFLPPMGGLDLSLLVLMVLMNFVNILLAKTIPFWAIA